MALQFLLLLVLAITPKKGLHDAFARHQHLATGAGNGEAQIQQGGFYCDIHDFVAESHFTPTEEVSAYRVFVVYQSHFAPLHASTVQKLAIAIDNKGPPPVAA
jgi:hypothetical protein